METDSSFSSVFPRAIRRSTLFFLSFGFALLFLMSQAASAAQTLTVNTLQDSSDATASCTTSGGTCSLRDAILQANADADGDAIEFAAGLSGTITLTSALPAITVDMTIQNAASPTAPGANSITISGNHAYQIFNISAGTLTISGLTLADGNAGSSSSGRGGAIYADITAGPLTVTSCTFTGNSAPAGFGDGGGAIYDNSSGALTVTNSTFSGNSAQAGGAILNTNDHTTEIVTNSTFSGNSAVSSGAAIRTVGALTVTNSIFAGNSVSPGDGAVSRGEYGFTESYNLFYNNTGGDFDEGGTPQNPSPTDATGNPNLLPLGSYGGPTQTMIPLPGSPAICAGLPADVPIGFSTDQRGFPRLNATYNGFSATTPCVDIGSVQTNYQSIQFVSPPVSGFNDVAGQPVNPPAPVVSVTENGQNIGGVPVTLTLSDFTGASSYTTGGLGPVTTVANSGATFGNLTVSTSGTGKLSAMLDLFTPKGGTPVSINTSQAPLTVLTPAQGIQNIINYVNTLYSGGALTSGQDNSLVMELNKAFDMLNKGKINGAINNLQDFISEVNDLYSSGVLNQTEAGTLLTDANNVIAALE